MTAIGVGEDQPGPSSRASHHAHANGHGMAPVGVHYLPPEAVGLFPSLGNQSQLSAHEHHQPQQYASSSQQLAPPFDPSSSSSLQQQQQQQQHHMRTFSQGSGPNPFLEARGQGSEGSYGTHAYPLVPTQATAVPAGLQGFPFAPTETQPNLQAPLMPAQNEPRTFSVEIRQHPVQGRMCGFGSKDRRPLDPVPIVQARVFGADGRRDLEAEASPHLMMQVALLFDHTQQEATMIKNPSDFHYPWRRALEGKLVASGHVVRDLNDEKACFFAFPDLSVRLEGVYRLRFSLLRIGMQTPDAAGGIVASATSDPFTVYSPREFPGMLESSELAKTLAKAGVLLATRSKGREANA